MVGVRGRVPSRKRAPASGIASSCKCGRAKWRCRISSPGDAPYRTPLRLGRIPPRGRRTGVTAEEARRALLGQRADDLSGPRFAQGRLDARRRGTRARWRLRSRAELQPSAGELHGARSGTPRRPRAIFGRHAPSPLHGDARVGPRQGARSAVDFGAAGAAQAPRGARLRRRAGATDEEERSGSPRARVVRTAAPPDHVRRRQPRRELPRHRGQGDHHGAWRDAHRRGGQGFGREAAVSARPHLERVRSGAGGSNLDRQACDTTGSPRHGFR